MSVNKNIPSVCIVGRPNVGKSSLFNWISGKRLAVVVKESGTTRDRVETLIEINKRKFNLVDTGGYLVEDKDHLAAMVKGQIAEAVRGADILIMVTDALTGIVAADVEVANIVRKSGKTVILAANKVDNKKIDSHVVDFYELAMGDPIKLSCLHNRGLKKLKDAIIENLPGENYSAQTKHEDCIKLAVVGRQNVGKSSYVNYLLDNDRVIVSDIPGTTRDSVDILFNDGKDNYVLIDTAGIKHKRKLNTVVDFFSIIRSKESIERADVTILMIDATSGVRNDDVDILKNIKEKGKACIVMVNKWDLAMEIEGVDQKTYRDKLIESSPILSILPIYFISAHSGKNVKKTFGEVKKLNKLLDKDYSTPALNKLFKKNSPQNVSVRRNVKRPNFLYITQTGRRPLEFTYFVNIKSSVGESHLNFIENVLRENFPLQGIPIKINTKTTRAARGEGR